MGDSGPAGLDDALQQLSTRWRGIDLRQLAYFAVVAREGHFGRAAVRLRLSQPPLSMQVKALESRLGARLLDRGRQATVPTAAGWALLETLGLLLPPLVEGLEQARATGRGERGRLRVGFVTPAGTSFLPGFVRALRERWPDIELSLNEATSDEQFVALADGRLDAGFVLPPAPDSLSFRQVHAERLVLAMPARLAAAFPASTLGAADLPDEPLLVFPREKAPGLHAEILAYFAAAGRAPVIGQQAIQMPTIVNLVAAGLGIALVPASIRRSAGADVAWRELDDKAPRIRIGVAWRPGATGGPLDRLLETLAQRLQG
ncbi:MAG: LysR family transcriptional regulator [Burkholderiaceae bacterium]|nr:LysR family transcriptional regulator [Burkholderiaceae bacterium]